jgi:hypothetical protein
MTWSKQRVGSSGRSQGENGYSCLKENNYLSAQLFLTMCKLTAIVFAVLCSTCILAQQAANDTARYGQSMQDAISSYFRFINDGSGIYNGVEHPPYFYKIEGIAYYKVDEWQKATIEYNGLLYTDVPAKYDQVKDQVIVKHPTGLSLGLFSPRVTYFILNGEKFIYIPGHGNNQIPAPGFYHQLRTGTFTALAKRRKWIEEKIEDHEIKRRIAFENRYYLVKEGVYYGLRKEKSLLALMGERRTEVRQALRKAKARFRKDPEKAVLTALDQYNK